MSVLFVGEVRRRWRTRRLPTGRVGSLQMGYLLVSEKLVAIAADGDSTIVAFDYAANRPRPVPDRVRQAIAQIEGAAR